ncbi:hypothetical protein RhiLY_13488 [Ceratobasidium sp. AG-Ba]|nr:hypothetical protein RhiLY_13488 [Ceratobasidium sp. AG-Ba]
MLIVTTHALASVMQPFNHSIPSSLGRSAARPLHRCAALSFWLTFTQSLPKSTAPQVDRALCRLLPNATASKRDPFDQDEPGGSPNVSRVRTIVRPLAPLWRDNPGAQALVLACTTRCGGRVPADLLVNGWRSPGRPC